MCLRPLKIQCDWPSKIRYIKISRSRMMFEIVFSKWMVHSTDWGEFIAPKDNFWEEMTSLNHAMCGPMPFLSQAFKEGIQLRFFPPCTKKVMPLKETCIETSDVASS